MRKCVLGKERSVQCQFTGVSFKTH